MLLVVVVEFRSLLTPGFFNALQRWRKFSTRGLRATWNIFIGSHSTKKTEFIKLLKVIFVQKNLIILPYIVTEWVQNAIVV